jgi:hypothetical protein
MVMRSSTLCVLSSLARMAGVAASSAGLDAGEKYAP